MRRDGPGRSGMRRESGMRGGSRRGFLERIWTLAFDTPSDPWQAKGAADKGVARARRLRARRLRARRLHARRLRARRLRALRLRALRLRARRLGAQPPN